MRTSLPRTVLPALTLLVLAGCAGPETDADPTTPPAEPTATPEPTTPEPEPTEPEPTAPDEPTDPEETEEPEPEPEPRPDLGDLVISPSGLGPLTVGVAPQGNPGEAMIVWDPAACAEIVSGEEEAGRWVPDGYGPDDVDFDGNQTVPFHVAADEESVGRIDVMGQTPVTPEGVGIGTSVEELRDTYPDLQGPYEGVVSRVWWLEEQDGILVLETQGDEDGLRAPGTAESVILIRVLEPGTDPEFATANTDDVAGGCL
jgi:hypothetical protein